MKENCKESIDGKHHLRREIITYDELFAQGRVVDRIPVFAERCVKCKLWGEVHNNDRGKN